MMVPIISVMLLMSAAIACPFSSACIFPVCGRGAFVLSACYMYTRVYECARYQPVLHVRITRNDRPGRFPLTLGAPAFLRRDRLLLNGHLIIRGAPKTEKGGAFSFYLYVRSERRNIKIIRLREYFRQCV